MKQSPQIEQASGPVQQWARKVGWSALIMLLVALPVGTLTIAFDMLMEMPSQANCRSRFRINPSDADRLYCAQNLANEGTIDSLQKAIALIEAWPTDHPLRRKHAPLVEAWSQQLLDLAEEEYQSGSLDNALTIARQISPHTDVYRTAREQMMVWQRTWQEAELIYTRVENAIASEEWVVALERARGLLAIDNRYWAGDRYEEISQQAQAGRESEMWAYMAEQRRRANLSNLSIDAWRQRWNLEQSTEDLAMLQQAETLARSGQVDDLREAIALSRRVIWGTTHYDRAQSLIDTWQEQIEVAEDSPRLSRARQLASSGDVESLEAAISEARRIPSYRTLHDQAQTDIEVWQDQIRDMTVDSMAEPAWQSDWEEPANLPDWAPTADPRSPLSPNWSPEADDRFSDAYQVDIEPPPRRN